MFALLRRGVEALERIAGDLGEIRKETQAMRAEQKQYMEISQNTDPTDKIFGFVDKLMGRQKIGPGKE